MWQLNVTTDTSTPNVFCATVSGFHYSGPTTCHNREPQFSYFTSDSLRLFVIGMIFLEAGRTKYSNTWPCKMQRTKAANEVHQHLHCKFKFFPPALWPF